MAEPIDLRPEFDIGRYGPAIPFVTRYLPFKDRVALEGTCHAIRSISIADGWQDVTSFDMRRSSWISHREAFYKPSMLFVELVLGRLSAAVTTLDLFAYTGNQTNLFRRISKKHFPLLTKVNLQRTILSLEMVTYLNNQENLQELTVGAVLPELEAVLQPTWKRLTKVRVVANYHTEGQFLHFLEPEQLTELILDVCPLVCRRLLRACVDRAVNLEILYISASRSVEDALTIITSRDRIKLKALTIGAWAPIVHLRDLRAPYVRLIQTTPNLTSLRLPRNEAIPLNVLCELSMGLTNLRVLELSETQLKERDLQVASLYLSNLEKLIIDKPNGYVTFEFLTNLTNLRRLRLRMMEAHVNIKNVIWYAIHQERLRTLDLRGMVCHSTSTFLPLSERETTLKVYLRDTELSEFIYPQQTMQLRNTILDFVN